jgi:murein DD-endopeptidase MepM/ murein hydrolase activator NlpD
MVELSPEDLARVERENRETARLWTREGPRRFALPLGGPLDPLPQGGRFGHRRIINGRPRSPHGGSDYSAEGGTPVLAAADGEVAMVADQFFGGNSVFVDHGDGLISMYMHLSRVDVAEGQAVRRGERVGAVGSTGRATGPHLHFGVRWHGARVDPDLLLGEPEALPAVE